MLFFNPIVSAAGMISLAFSASACSQSTLMSQNLLPSAVQAKLDPRLLHRLQELEKNAQEDEKLSVLIRTASEMNPDQEALILKKGAIINSKLGNIVSAVVPAGSVSDVAALAFVLRIELAKKLKERKDP